MSTDRAPDPVTDAWELLWTAACDYRDAAGPDRSEARLVDALMPIVTAYGDARVSQAEARGQAEGYRKAVEESRRFCARSGGCIS